MPIGNPPAFANKWATSVWIHGAGCWMAELSEYYKHSDWANFSACVCFTCNLRIPSLSGRLKKNTIILYNICLAPPIYLIFQIITIYLLDIKIFTFWISRERLVLWNESLCLKMSLFCNFLMNLTIFIFIIYFFDDL